MDTSSPDYDSEISYQTSFCESDDAETFTAAAFSEYALDDIVYPDEVSEEEQCRVNRVSHHCHPRGASEDAPSESAATEYARSLLKGPDHIFKQVLRVTKIQFHRLVRWLCVNTAFEDNQHRTCEQRVMVFLYIMGLGKTQRSAAHQFRMSQPSVGRIFHEVLTYMQSLHNAFVQLPGDVYVSDKIVTDEKYFVFNGCIGAIDSMHIAAHVPLDQQSRFRSRKGGISQKVFAAVTFGGRFVYVLAGAEGSVDNATLLRIASTKKDFVVPEGRFFIAGTGFGNSRPGVLCPYAKTRYRVQDYAKSGLLPDTPEEVYNVTHSSIQVTVEKAFSMMTKRWEILSSSAPEYSVLDQSRIVLAATGLHNFVLMDGLEPDDYIEREEEAFSAYEKLTRTDSLEMADAVVGERTAEDLRDEIAQDLWDNYAYHWANAVV
ncbi:uncharacterized protein CPUR_02029 [Claviceps purpurea 20.1]|uniref:Uncharacterized protein n=1 Tax=Claviceps purpurea (strain 20.1) TaxID=1111077 RepID=M1WIT3_CLAP2|nr:uncharacterized protein CPUR_02029 [Claviceps purpurea 20.1]